MMYKFIIYYHFNEIINIEYRNIELNVCIDYFKITLSQDKSKRLSHFLNKVNKL